MSHIGAPKAQYKHAIDKKNTGRSNMSFNPNLKTMCGSRKYPYPPQMVNGNSQGVGGLKGRSFQGVWGVGHVKNFQEVLTLQIVLHKLTVSILICSAPKP